MECILDCNSHITVLEAPLGREKNTVPQGYGMIFDCNYFLLKASLGRESNTVPKGYGMYFRLSLYLAEKLR